MIENGYDEHKILGMDALNKAPRPSEETLNKNRWSKGYRDERLQGTQTIRRTDKSGGAGTIARTAEPDFEEVLSKKPKNEYQKAGGDSGTSSSSRQWGQSSWQPKSQPYQIAGKKIFRDTRPKFRKRRHSVAAEPLARASVKRQMGWRRL
jgi:hypothetical protein